MSDGGGASSPFDDIHLGWQGKTLTIPAHRVMGAIKRIEDHVTLAELQADAGRGTLRLGKLSAAYADVLRYAGANGVTEEDVYAGMFGVDAQKNVVGAIAGLLGMMIPRNVRLGVTPSGEGNRRQRRAAGKPRKTGRSSSKRHSG